MFAVLCCGLFIEWPDFRPGAKDFNCIPTGIKPRSSELIALDFFAWKCRYYSALFFYKRLSINIKNSARL